MTQDWFRRILNNLVADSRGLSDELRVRMHKAAIVVALSMGGGWGAFRRAFTVVKATVLCPQAVGERLIELLTMAYQRAGTDRPAIDRRGDVVLAVERFVGPLQEGDDRDYAVTTHQRRYRAHAASLREQGVSSLHPMLLSVQEHEEMKALILATKWGEDQGYFQKSWTVREDGSLEVGLHPTGRSHDSRPDDVVLYQHHVDKASDVTRERDFARMESRRTGRSGEEISFPLYDVVVAPSGRITLSNERSWFSSFNPNDKQDRDDSDRHEGYHGLAPLDAPKLVDNQLRTRRVRARVGWEIRAYTLKDGVYSRISDGTDGSPWQDFYADPRQRVSWKDKESGKWVTVERWNKRSVPRSTLEFKVPIGTNELGYELYELVRGRDISSADAVSLLHDKSVTVHRDPTFRRELEGMFLSAAEGREYSRLEFFQKDRGFGSESHPVIPGATPCLKCDEKFGGVKDAIKATWCEKPHAYVCNSCGTEIWKVGVRIYIDAKYLPFLVARDKRVTHYAAEFYGDWVRELLVNAKNWAAEKGPSAMLADGPKEARTRLVNIGREPCDTYIGRGPWGSIPLEPEMKGYFGNPFVMKDASDPEERRKVLVEYRNWFLKRVLEDPVFATAVATLKGKRLGCFCTPAACHGDVIAAWLEGTS